MIPEQEPTPIPEQEPISKPDIYFAAPDINFAEPDLNFDELAKEISKWYLDDGGLMDWFHATDDAVQVNVAYDDEIASVGSECDFSFDIKPQFEGYTLGE
jgi:hypothetical protein